MSASRCHTCGMRLRDPGEYHPHAFCVLFAAGIEPWPTFRVMRAQVGLGDPGAHAPRVVETWPRRKSERSAVVRDQGGNA